MFLDNSETLLRILVSLLAGGAVGFEREKRGRDAGFRTHLLVSVGACIFTLIELEGINQVFRLALANEAIGSSLNVSVHRLTAQVITGIGFLGAGTIIVTKRSIRGLTTAASIWVCAALGMASGYGYYNIVLFGVVAILLVLLAMKRLFSFPHMTILTVSYHGQSGMEAKLVAFLEQHDVKLLEKESKTSLSERGMRHDINFHIDTRQIDSSEGFMDLIDLQGDFEEVIIRSSMEE